MSYNNDRGETYGIIRVFAICPHYERAGHKFTKEGCLLAVTWKSLLLRLSHCAAFSSTMAWLSGSVYPVHEEHV